MTDDHTAATVHDVRLGREPLVSFAVRNVLSRKSAHADGLARTIKSL